VNAPLARRGVRVRRGPDWASGDEDRGAEGVIVDVDSEGRATVFWDFTGESGPYRIGQEGKCDLQVVGKLSDLVTVLGKVHTGNEPVSGSLARPETRVVRGSDWKWGLQDGAGVGIVQSEVSRLAGWVPVKWENSCQTADYRVGYEECYDLALAEEGQHVSQIPQCQCSQDLVLQVDVEHSHECDLCSSEILARHPMRRCGICDFDLCPDCFLGLVGSASKEATQLRPRRQCTSDLLRSSAGLKGSQENERLRDLARKESTYPQGVSVNYLHAFFKQRVKVEYPEHKTFADLGDFIWGKPKLRRKIPVDFLQHGSLTDPKDGIQGVSLCHAIGATDADHVGDANLFVSWVWRYNIDEFVDALYLYCSEQEQDPARTFVWVCFFCNNQRHWLKPAAGFAPPNGIEIFGKTLKKIKRMVCVLDDSMNALYFKRVWTVYEVFLALSLKKLVDVEVVLLPAAREKFLSALPKSQDLIIDVMKAQATEPKDMELILGELSENADDVNRLVANCLKLGLSKLVGDRWAGVK